MKINMKKVLAGLILTGGGFITTGASAAVIGSFSWVSDGGFVESASTCSNGALQTNCSIGYDNVGVVTPSGIAGTSSLMTWGTGTTTGGGNGQKSGLQGVFGASGTGGYNAAALGSGAVAIPMFSDIMTNGGWTNTGAAVHYNNVITAAGGYMNTSDLATTFQLGAFPAVSATLDISLTETTNSAPCAGPNPLGTVCDDIFSVSAALAPIAFTIDDYDYVLSFQFAAGPGAFVIGNTIYTAEDSPGSSVVFVQAQIVATPNNVPLPGVMVLMGLGLMMLGFQVRGKNLV